MNKIKNSRLIIILLSIAITISACQKGTPTVDPIQKITEVALTIQAEFTKLAAQPPTITPTLLPTATATEVQATPTLDILTITVTATPGPTITPTPFPTATAIVVPATPTLDVLIVTVTATPTPTNRPTTNASSDDNAAWVTDVTYPDGTIVKPGTTFVKTWRIKNTGKTEWTTAYRLVYFDGLHGANEVLVVHLPHSLKPGLTMDVSVSFTAPADFGTYYSYWRLYNADRKSFGEQLSLKIVVGNP